jgi:hypothetical protein
MKCRDCGRQRADGLVDGAVICRACHDPVFPDRSPSPLLVRQERQAQAEIRPRSGNVDNVVPIRQAAPATFERPGA